MALNASETVKNALKLLQDWTPKSDVWAFKHGQTILLGSTAVTASYINYKFRKALKLKNFAFMTTYMASVCIPAIFSPLLHGAFVVAPALEGRRICPVCLETRSSLLQVASSVVYPLLLSPVACFQFADRYMTAAIPPVWPQPQLVLQKYLSIVKPLSKQLVLFAVLNSVVGAGLVYAEYQNMMTVTQKLEVMEQVVSENVSTERLQQIKKKANEDEEVIQNEPKLKLPFNFD